MRTTAPVTNSGIEEEAAAPPGAGAEAGTRRRRGPAVNSVHLLGRLTADPELHYSAGGVGVVKMRLATNEGAEPEFHDVVAWRQLAELCAEHLTKGRLVFVEGRLHSYAWHADDGSVGRRCVEVAADSVQFVDPPRRDGNRSSPRAGDGGD